MTPVERIERLLEMEIRSEQKDDAGIYVPNGLDSAIKQKVYQECLRILKGSECINSL